MDVCSSHSSTEARPFDISLNFQRDLRALELVPFDLFVLVHKRFIFLGIDLDFEEVSGCSRPGPGNDFDWFSGRELTIHAGRGNADALLAAAHTKAMKF